MKRWFQTVLVLTLMVSVIHAGEEQYRFAWFTDTHIGSNTAAEDLKLAVADVNTQDNLDFVIVSGDITELDINGYLETAKAILDELQIPYHIIPGNHDTKWSASGTRNYAALFGNDCFNVEYQGIRFIGFDQGPLLRMGDGLVTPERIRWLDNTLQNLENPDQPILIVTHYPLDQSVSNWFEVMDIIKTYNIQGILHGHGHRNRLADYEGIPGIMSRSTLRRYAGYSGYTIATVRPDSVLFQERNAAGKTLPVWASIPIKNYDWQSDTADFERPNFSVNEKYHKVREIWSVDAEWSVAGSPAVSADLVIVGNSSGNVTAYDADNGGERWQFRTGQAIYSTPAVSADRVVVSSTDSCLYGLDLSGGKMIWKYCTEAPLVANPLIKGKRVFCGGSDGVFRCLDLEDGSLIWKYDGIEGFVESRPVIDKNRVIFGAWDEHLYALHRRSGKLLWKWSDGRPGNLYSPAAVWPVVTRNRVFISAPDRYLSCINARNGETLWRSSEFKVRETIGISEDRQVVFARTMWDTVVAINPAAGELEPIWVSDVDYGYDIDPSMPVEKNGILFFGTKDGFVYALDAVTGEVKGMHRMSVALINTVVPLDNRRVAATSMDGRIAVLEFN